MIDKAIQDGAALTERIECLTRDLRAERYLLELEYRKLIKKMKLEIALLILTIAFFMAGMASFLGTR